MDKDLSNPRTLELITNARSDSLANELNDQDNEQQMLFNE